MKYLAVVLGIIFLASCGDKEREGRHHHSDSGIHERMNISMQERDSIHEERKRKMVDRLTEKLDLTEDQIRKIKQLDANYTPQLKELRTQMFESRKKHHQLLEEKRTKMKEILTSEQVQKLETMRKGFKRRGHDKFKGKNHKEKQDS